MRLLRTVDELAGFKGGAYVPTMGALHAGHAALIEHARTVAEHGRPVIVSLFVNPTQFAPGEDFDRYPRSLDADLAVAAGAGASAVFAPDVETIYPREAPVPIPPLPAVATQPGLEDAHRPGHFAGVCQVCARLFDLVRPMLAIFGEKDWQQLLVVKAMVAAERDRWPGLGIVSHEIVREPDGLAMSSRNAYLDGAERVRAAAIRRALIAARGEGAPAEAERAMRAVLDAAGLRVEYAAVRDAETLLRIETFARPGRALIAARAEGVRLIDNAPLPA